MMDRDELLRNIPIVTYLNDRGVNLRASGGKFITESCPACRNHKKGHLCVSIDPDRGLWHCNDSDRGGSVIDWEMAATGKTAGEVLKEFSARFEPASAPQITALPDTEIEKAYDYRDENGVVRYQNVRFRPKTFRPRQPDGNGGWTWNLDGISRLPYNLPEVLKAQTVVVVEGEKDADNVSNLGIVATTAFGGAKGWLPAYGNFLKGKDVVIIPDTNKAGHEFAEAVHNSIQDKALSIRRLDLPADYRDISHYLENQPDADINKMIEASHTVLEKVPIFSMVEVEKQYIDFINRPKAKFSLAKLSPGLKECTERLMPGEMILVVGGPSAGKSTVLKNIAMASSPQPTVYFSLELDNRRMFSRVMQNQLGCTEEEVQREYKENKHTYCSEIESLRHLFLCDKSGLSLGQIEDWLGRIELKIGAKPEVVLIDYVQLLGGSGNSERYEHMSKVAEQLRVLARRTDTVMIIASQRSRPDSKAKSQRVTLHSPKDSGSLENSSTVVLGLDRVAYDLLDVSCLKNNNGKQDFSVQFRFNGAHMKIEEIDPIMPADGVCYNTAQAA